MLSETYAVFQGGTLKIYPVTLKDAYGNPITAYLGTETLSATLWLGGNQVAAITNVPTWLTWTPAVNTISVIISSMQTVAVSPGSYTLLVRATSGSEVDDAYACTVVILPFAGGIP